jgi:hypothetical protein
MFRRVVLFLVAYPLLLPPGMCICGAAQDREDHSRQSACGHRHSCTFAGCRESQLCSNLCSVTPGVPADDQCPPSCPASKQADHSRLAEKPAEKWSVVTVWASAIVPPAPCVAAVSGERLELASLLSAPPAAPLYIALRTLRI